MEHGRQPITDLALGDRTWCASDGDCALERARLTGLVNIHVGTGDVLYLPNCAALLADDLAYHPIWHPNGLARLLLRDRGSQPITAGRDRVRPRRSDISCLCFRHSRLSSRWWWSLGSSRGVAR